MHCIGSGFDPGCVVVFAGHPEVTDFHSDTDVSTYLNSALWQGADTVQVGVVSPQRGGSATLPFQITP